MYRVARLSDGDRQALFRNSAAKLGLHEAVVEKDFWVCLMLDYLFHHCPYKSSFTFKGGTSLSKCYGLIKRFSEDIDLILDWRVLGYSMDEPWLDRSNSQQGRFNEETGQKSERFIADVLLPLVRNDLSHLIGQDVVLSVDSTDPQTLVFHYPRIFQVAGILQSIRLEIGALAAWTPASERAVVPYSAECYPHVFNQKVTSILTTDAVRTFWEKVTILHHEANRPEHSLIPARYSRHYYDVYCMAQADIHLQAFQQLPLLQRVVDFKMKFYPRKWARYEEAVPGTIRLMPPDFRIAELRADYSKMSEMMFDDAPAFDEILTCLQALEHQVNALS